MGLRRIDDFSVALFHKWKWRILEEASSLWCPVLGARYGDLRISVVIGGGGSRGNIAISSWWADIKSIDKHVNSYFSITHVALLWEMAIKFPFGTQIGTETAL